MKAKKDINGYSLSRSWFDFCFENPEKIRPNHTALYFFIIEHCNRLGWKEKFGLPTTMTMEAIGMRSYNTYKNTLDDLISFGFIVMIEKSKNQYSSNIVALSNFDKALDGALDKAIVKKEGCSIKKSESTIQSTIQSTGESIDSINKPINQEPLTREIAPAQVFSENIKRFIDWLKEKAPIYYSNPENFEHFITDEELLTLKEKYNFLQIEVVVKKLDNRIDLYERYNNFFTTIMHWLQREYNPGQPISAAQKVSETTYTKF
ncbi:hypothetical protein SDC9_137187 [bioreactor metagenome]|uniref:Uncharacterized protein n=1 Tax=bioreactor metagenome TaxID=1076179 RepID=A0A645DLF4_9ZZZZ|nr:hypothetical protein [Petrimonas sp.]